MGVIVVAVLAELGVAVYFVGGGVFGYVGLCVDLCVIVCGCV